MATPMVLPLVIMVSTVLWRVFVCVLYVAYYLALVSLGFVLLAVYRPTLILAIPIPCPRRWRRR